MDLTTINRFPILIRFASLRANRSSQLRGNASIRPPNSVSSADESLRERHTISSSRRLRSGLRTITSCPGACAWRRSSCALSQCISAVLRHRYTGKIGAGDEARTRDVHLGKVVLYQLSYTRSFERDNNVQPTAPRNLLIASECSKSLNPNRTFAASYDQTLYEKTIPPLHVLARVVWQLVSPSSNRSPDCRPDSTDGSNSRDSGNLNSVASIQPQHLVRRLVPLHPISPTKFTGSWRKSLVTSMASSSMVTKMAIT